MFLDGNVSVDVNKLAEQLAKIAGPIAQHGWEVYVRQQYVIGVQQLVGAGVLLLVAIGCVLAAAWAVRSHDRQIDRYDRELAEWTKFDSAKRLRSTKPSSPDCAAELLVLVLFGLIGVVAIIVAVCLASDAFAHFYNPEYGAIQGILGR